jgi:hypothetical protein
MPLPCRNGDPLDRSAAESGTSLKPAQKLPERTINFLNFLDLAQKTALLCICMHASRFSFAFTYRYSFTGSGEADGVLTKR